MNNCGRSAEKALKERPEHKLAVSASRGLTLLLLAAFAVDLCVSLLGLALQFLGIYLNAATVVLGLYGTIGAGVYALMCLPAGRASDRFSRRVAAIFITVAGIIWLILGLQRSPYTILLLIPFSSGSIAFFWPSVQAWLGDLASDRQHLTRILGTFNVLWTAGLMIGPVVAGYLWQMHHFAPFFWATVIAWAAAVMLLVVPLSRGGLSRQAEGVQESLDHFDPRAEQFLPLAWAANFASWYASGATRTLFPKLGTELGYSEVVIGWIVFGMLAGQLITFVLLRQGTWWHLRRWPLLFGLVIGCFGAVGTVFANTPLAFVISLAAIGASVGFTYVTSLFYSLQAPPAVRGKRTGIHETIVGAGLSLGPLVGGIVGSYWGLRAPFAACVIVFVAALIAQFILASRTRRA